MAAYGEGPGGRGLALRFPRFLQIREDKSVEDATSPPHVLSLFHKQANRSGVCVFVCVCLCLCVCEGENGREDRDKDRNRDRDRDRNRDRDRDRDRNII